MHQLVVALMAILSHVGRGHEYVHQEDVDDEKTLMEKSLVFDRLSIASLAKTYRSDDEDVAMLKKSHPNLYIWQYNPFTDRKNVTFNYLRLQEKRKLLNLFNYLRTHVDPPAADMQILEWDVRLEVKAYEYAAECVWTLQKNVDKDRYGYTNKMLQDVNAVKAVFDWYREGVNYDVQAMKCALYKNCRNYTQVMWSASRNVGCATVQCGKIFFNHVCMYSPKGNKEMISAYVVGTPCTFCRFVRSMGSLCYLRACVSRKTCKRFDLKCKCKLSHCYNCGTLNVEECICRCPDGWDGTDCSLPCENLGPYCTLTPGFDKEDCYEQSGNNRNVLCRKMCGQCTTRDDGLEDCCGKEPCALGKTFNAKCECKTLCREYSHCVGTSSPITSTGGVLMSVLLGVQIINTTSRR